MRGDFGAECYGDWRVGGREWVSKRCEPVKGDSCSDVLLYPGCLAMAVCYPVQVVFWNYVVLKVELGFSFYLCVFIKAICEVVSEIIGYWLYVCDVFVFLCERNPYE